jgi:hypothetical protein
MTTIYTATNALKLLPFATSVEAVREFRTCVQVTYWVHGRRCSTFLSRRAFLNLPEFSEPVAQIICDDDLTQPWVVVVNGKEVYRASTHSRCTSYVRWHHRRTVISWSTGNEWTALAS